MANKYKYGSYLTAEEKERDTLLIAEALDWIVIRSGNLPVKVRKKTGGFSYTAKNTSWNSLIAIMPIVEEIEELPTLEHHGRFIVHISGRSCSIQGSNLQEYIDKPESFTSPVFFNDISADNKIDAIYKSVMDFFAWYIEEKNGIKIKEERNFFRYEWNDLNFMGFRPYRGRGIMEQISEAEAIDNNVVSTSIDWPHDWMTGSSE